MRDDRRIKIFAVKFIHTLIYFQQSAAIGHVLYAVLRGKPSRLTAAAIVSVCVEGAVLAANDGRCPLRVMAEDLGAEDGRVTDIFLPEWLAERTFQIYTPLFLLGCAGVGWRWFAARRTRAVS